METQLSGRVIWLVAAVVVGLLALVALAVVGPRIGDATPPGNAERATAELREYLQERDGDYGIAVHDLSDDSSAGVNADEAYPMASLYKLLVMYRVMSEVESGQLSLDAPLTITPEDAQEGDPSNGLQPGDRVVVREALERMIAVSSNAAAYALARQVGGWERVRSVPGELEMRHTVFDEYWYSTPEDVRHFLVRLAKRDLVSAEASQTMIAILERQQRDDRIPAGLPDSVTVAHKTGELERVRNDAGIVEGPGAHYVLVVMAKDTEPSVAIRTHAEVSRIVYRTLSGTEE